MIALTLLEDYLADLLAVASIKDYAPNGLQVAGNSQVKKIITGVSACQPLLDAAVAQQADAILVHHGYFWKNENPCITGIKHQRLKTLLTHNLSLLAYHLPLDIHAELGNNAQLGQLLDIQLSRREFTSEKLPLICIGELTVPRTNAEFADILQHKLQRKAFSVAGATPLIKTVAWCTGAAQDFIDIALANKVDAYLTGEVSERTVHIAREAGLHFFAAGHHATERYGIAALGEHLAQHFGLEHHFIDIDNPI